MVEIALAAYSALCGYYALDSDSWAGGIAAVAVFALSYEAGEALYELFELNAGPE